MIKMRKNGGGSSAGTIAEKILIAHNSLGSSGQRPASLRIRFDKLTSHDITYVGIIQTARASGLKEFPMPYVLTNCHNSLCAVGGTINEDDHLFGLSAAKKYGGIYVPAHQAVIHQYAREMLAKCGDMILGSDSHTRYGALGTMAIGEGGPELVKQLLGQTYDIAFPEIINVRLTGAPKPGVGPQDVALALIGAVFGNGFVKNKVLEFTGPGIANLSVDFRIGVDVMTTETTCLSSIWETDEKVKEFYRIHGREADYRELKADENAVYDGTIDIDLSEVEPMIAMPFHPSNVYTIRELQENLTDILSEVEKKAKEQLGPDTELNLLSKVSEGKLRVDQGIIAGCAGGGFENICSAAEVLSGGDIGADAFSLSVYPASTPIYMEILKNGAAAKLLGAGAILKTAFCGPCFGAGDTPGNQGFSIRHSTRNFPNREGSKPGQGQIASVALMDARSIAATAANHGILTSATQLLEQCPENPYAKIFHIKSAANADIYKEENNSVETSAYPYHFDAGIYKRRVFDGWGKAAPETELVMGPNIKDWPAMPALPENLLLKTVSFITDPVTTTDELIPSGETSSYRSNPLGLAEYTLSRKDPEYVRRAKEVRDGEMPEWVRAQAEELLTKKDSELGYMSTIFAVMPGDGSAREQAASCQRVLGAGANIAKAYATKRYRSNLINWGMLPLTLADGQADPASLPFGLGDFLLLPGIRETVKTGGSEVQGYVLKEGAKAVPVSMSLGSLTEDERQILLAGCLINFNRVNFCARPH
ncbi:MAG: hydratase [Lachnospiraceae bacterium]|nr:hydratase [Lachnospiraceae bacterium]